MNFCFFEYFYLNNDKNKVNVELTINTGIFYITLTYYSNLYTYVATLLDDFKFTVTMRGHIKAS